MKSRLIAPVWALIGIFAGASASAVEIGALDTSFGSDGMVETAVGHFADQAYAVTVQPDGRIVVAGSSSNGSNLDFALVRYEADGGLDSSFNLDGTVTTQVGRDDDEIAAVVVQDDGYIIAAGYSVTMGNRDFALARYFPNGELDYSFGQGGAVVLDYSGSDDEITAIAGDGNGRILVAGYTTGTQGRAVVLARFLEDGGLDPSFGYRGMSLTGIGDDALARSIDVDDQGRIVVTGSYNYDDRTEVLLLRFTESGELDDGFGTDGLAVSSYEQSSTEGFGVRVHESGAILIAGAVGAEGERDAALFLFSETGHPEGGFGDNGMLATEVSENDDMALAVDVRDNVITLSGFSTPGEQREFLFITHEVEFQEVERVAFSLKTGSSTTGLWIGERQVYGSYSEFQGEPINPGMDILQTIVNTTPFGFFSDDISYAVEMQPDGKAVAAGFTEQGGVTQIAVARYGAAGAVQLEADEFVTTVGWITTKEPAQINRTGATTGGIITNPPGTVTKRGVFFSTNPDADLPGGGTGESNAPVISGEKSIEVSEAGKTETKTLSVTTTRAAECRYSMTKDTLFDNMTNFLVSSSDQKNHSKELQVTDGETYYVRCKDIATGDKNTTDFAIEIIVEPTAGSMLRPFGPLKEYAGSIGGLFVTTAHAQQITVTEEEAASKSSVFSFSATGSTKGVFDYSTDPFVDEGQTVDGEGAGGFTSVLTNLRPGTYYYVWAYAEVDGQTYYGNQVTFRTADSCFIATAAYGSLFHPYVQVLREFRDRYLATNLPGRLFVDAYYRFSPPAADFISSYPIARKAAQVALLPVVAIGWLFVELGAMTLLFIGMMPLAGAWAYCTWRQRKAVPIN